MAFLQQIQVSADAELFQGAGDPGGAQVQRPLLHMLPGGEHLIGGQFPGDHPGVPGRLPERPHVRVPPPGLLLPGRRLRVQFQDHPVRRRPQLPERQRPRRPGQRRISRGHVVGGQDLGLLFDDPQVHRVQRAGVQRGQAPRQPSGHRGGVVQLHRGGPGRQVQLAGQLIGGELRPGDLTAPPGGELRDRGQRVPRDPGFQPPDRGDDPDQLIIGQRARSGPVRAGDRVDDGGQQRIRRHLRRRAGLREPVRVKRPGGHGQEQALRPGIRIDGPGIPDAGKVGVGPLRRRVVAGFLTVARFPAVLAWAGEWVREHAPRSVRKERAGNHPVTIILALTCSRKHYLGSIFERFSLAPRVRLSAHDTRRGAVRRLQRNSPTPPSRPRPPGAASRGTRGQSGGCGSTPARDPGLRYKCESPAVTHSSSR